MKGWVVSAVKRLLNRRNLDLEWLVLDWFGGEPLLAMNIVEEIQNHVLGLLRSRPNLVLQSAMTTNAFLLDHDRLTRLLDLGIDEFSIALDGPKELHDNTRVTSQGSGTFDRIWANLLAARQLDQTFKIVVRLQIGQGSAEFVPDFFNIYREELKGDERFELAIVPLRNFHPALGEPVVSKRHREIVSAARKRAESMGLAVCSSPNELSVCHAARANTFIVRPNGALCKCPVALDHPQNRVGTLLEDGRVKIDDQKMSRWMRGLESGDETELSCPMIGLADERDQFQESR